MGVYIKGLDMPKSCNKCPFTCEALQFFNGKDRPQRCPLVEIDLVTCGECIRSGTDGENTFCMWQGALRQPTDFCSYGERNEDFNPYQGERDRDENGEIY